MRNCFFLSVLVLGICFYSCKKGHVTDADSTVNHEKTSLALLEKMSIEEKISLLGYKSPALPQHQLSEYNWWNEALHGLARNGQATIFPQAIALAASFNPDLLEEVASVISTEARAKYNINRKSGTLGMYQGLTFWSPNINIFRDPRWGRGQETYGEDPFLTGAIGSAFVRGMQGNDPEYLKTAACAKHFAVHSGPEATRHIFDAIVDEKDLRETYLYAFRKLSDASVEGMMCAYNRVNGEPCCANDLLLNQILRQEWKFKGHLVTDCGALYNLFQSHKTAVDGAEATAQAIKAGISIDCADVMQKFAKEALERGLITEEDIDKVLLKSLITRFRLGIDGGHSPYDQYGSDSISNAYHSRLAHVMAVESTVLLHNEKNLLPLNTGDRKSYMILGPNATSADALMGNYHGVNGKMVNFMEGITQVLGNDARIEYDMGCDYKDTTHFGGIWAAGNADISLVFLGLTPLYEGENGDAFLSENGADKLNLSIPMAHKIFLKKLREGTKTPIVLVLTSGSPLDINELKPYADAILLAWYPGQEGGKAIADILFGKENPGGRLPLTFYDKFSDLPDYNSYSMAGRTYRYFEGKVQYPFGFGLSYTKFEYQWLDKPEIKNETINLSVKIKNVGDFAGKEVVQVYVSYPQEERMPVKELKAFKKSKLLAPGDEVVAAFSVPLEELKKWDLNEKKWKLYKGKYSIKVGSSADDSRLVSEFIL